MTSLSREGKSSQVYVISLYYIIAVRYRVEFSKRGIVCGNPRVMRFEKINNAYFFYFEQNNFKITIFRDHLLSNYTNI